MSNMQIWDAVSKTMPGDTKPVALGRRKFTAIDAYSQIRRATELWGPMGGKWGYTATWNIRDDLLFVSLTLYYHQAENRCEVGPVVCCTAVRNKDGKVDEDAGKKAITDGITKALSYLGFNADIFLGRYDDSKYVQQMRAEESQQNQPAPIPEAPPALDVDGLKKAVASCPDVSSLWTSYCHCRDKYTAEAERETIRAAFAPAMLNKILAQCSGASIDTLSKMATFVEDTAKGVIVGAELAVVQGAIDAAIKAHRTQ